MYNDKYVKCMAIYCLIPNNKSSKGLIERKSPYILVWEENKENMCDKFQRL